MLTENNETKPQTYEKSGYPIYKAKKTGDGAASNWVMSRSRDGKPASLFLEIAKQNGEDQNGNARFSWRFWDKDLQGWKPHVSITAKLGLPDIGEILLVLNGVKKVAGPDGKGLYHTNQNGSTTINFSTWEKDGQLLGYALRLTNKVGQSEATSISHSISLAEAENLRILLQNSVLQICNW